VERATLPAALEVIAETADGLIMGLRHCEYPTWGVQFHPESIMTREGKDILRAFLAEPGAAGALVGGGALTTGGRR
jgi:anthranilate/para-aminobenzoate synthase component II